MKRIFALFILIVSSSVLAQSWPVSPSSTSTGTGSTVLSIAPVLTGSVTDTGTLFIGTPGANPSDAVLEVYSGTTGNNSAHFHNNGVHGATGGGKISLNSTPTATPAAMVSGDRLGLLEWGGTYDNSLTLKNGSDIGGFATETWTSAHAGSKIVFNTVPNGTTTKTAALTLDQDQSVTLTEHLTINGTTTVINSGDCGTTSNGSVAGTDHSGKITIGSATTTACKVTFGKTFTTTPGACVFAPATSASAALTVLAYVSTIQTTYFTISGSALASTSFYYWCE